MHEHEHESVHVSEPSPELVSDIEKVVKIVERRTMDWMAQRETMIGQLLTLHATIGSLLALLGAPPSTAIAADTTTADDEPVEVAAIDLTPHNIDVTPHTNGSGTRKHRKQQRKQRKLHWTQRPENKHKLARVLRKASKARHAAAAEA